MAYQIVKKDELMHYGIKGQQKGVRRYQNADGSLTREGMLRYGIGLNNNKPKSAAEYVQQQREAKKAQEKQRIAQAVAKTKATKVPVYNDGPDKPKLTQTSGTPLKQKLSDAVKDDKTLKEKIENKVEEKKSGVEMVTDSKGRVTSIKSDTGLTYKLWDDNDQDFKEYDQILESKSYNKYRLGNTDFAGFQLSNGDYVITEEDAIWKLPKGVTLDGMQAALESAEKEMERRRDDSDYTNTTFVEIATNAINNVIKQKKKSSGELMHYGIFGMKWGIRRYQYEDGTLTPAGKKRYRNGYSPDHYPLPDGKYPAELSNEELNARIQRMNKENQYSKLAEERFVSKGEAEFKKYSSQFLDKVLTGVIAGVSMYLVNKLASKTWDKVKEKAGDKVKDKIIDKATGG